MVLLISFPGTRMPLVERRLTSLSPSFPRGTISTKQETMLRREMEGSKV